LHPSVVGMAQDFVGSNNVNLLIPSGQFGTRLIGGADAASARYIFTYPSPITRLIFPEVDEALLTYCEDDGQLIEPFFYCPIIPMLLVNGCQGIGTGWSSTIPPFNPIDVLHYIRAKLNKDSKLPEIRPFARGFTGTIEKRPSGDGYSTSGRAVKIDKSTILIDELPLRCWTSNYKDFLLGLQQKGVISNFFEDHTTTKVSFTVTVKTSQMMKLERSGFESAFKLQSSMLTTNMHAFNANRVIRKYETPEEIADDFFVVRMKLYEDRKSVMESEMQYLALLARNKAKFIQAVTSNGIDLLSGKKSKQETVQKMQELGFSTDTDLKAVRNDNDPFRRNKLLTVSNDTLSIEAGNEEAVDGDSNDELGEYDYLLNMPLSSLTAEKVLGLQQEALIKDKELEIIKRTTPTDLWLEDLKKLDSHLKRIVKS
jgi:DNA topoisomerase II